jgi:hypothetical protein
VGPYISYDLLQTKREMCAKFGSDRFRNVDMYKFHTNKHSSLYIRDIYIYIYIRYTHTHTHTNEDITSPFYDGLLVISYYMESNRIILFPCL